MEAAAPPSLRAVLSRAPAAALSLLLVMVPLGAIGPRAAAASDEPGTRPPAVAGDFYPGDAAMLRGAIRFYMEDAVPPVVAAPVVVIVPHAGYIYSGQIAADGYRQASVRQYETVVILGTNHHGPPFEGASIWYGGAYETPLGRAEVDGETARAILAEDRRFTFRPEIHEEEHSIEVQVPFVQTLFPGARIVPIVVGSPDPEVCEALGAAIARTVAGRSVLIVASSDLSHYPRYEDAVEADRRMLRSIARLDPTGVREEAGAPWRRDVPSLVTSACGEGPILTALHAARMLGAGRCAVLSCANSGDSPIGDRSRVVGYGSVVIGEGTGPPDLSGLKRFDADAEEGEEEEGGLSADERDFLLRYARRTITQILLTRTAPLARPDDPKLWRKKGVFVTLKKGERLRGCIGHMAYDLPLCQVAGKMALQAAFNDRRFSPLSLEELDAVHLEISVLSPRRGIDTPEEIVLGRDGIVLEKSGHSAVYLPQVAPEQGWDREETLTHLCGKAGLPGDCWKKGAELLVFQAEVFGEKAH